MPTSGQRKWYPRKPPTLQIKILNTIATNGPLSKNMAKKITGSHYPDVSDAIDKLVRSGLICIADVRLNDHDKRFFKLSRKGLECFIDSIPNPQDFWAALRWFCRLRKKRMDWDEFNMLYFRFQNTYFGYAPRYGYFFQFKFVHKLFEKWLTDNQTKMVGFIPFQRVLECLGMNRLVTFDELYKHIEDQRPVFEKRYSEEHAYFSHHTTVREVVENTLRDYTLSAKYQRPYHTPKPDIRYEFDERMNEYVDFLRHLIVIYRYDKNGNKRYELSLFGIALLLSLKAEYYWNPEMLFYNEFESEEYCRRI